MGEVQRTLDRRRAVFTDALDRGEIPRDVYDILAESMWSPELTFGLARNRSCPLNILVWLTWDTNQSVRRAAAENPSCTPELLERLAKSGGADRRAAVASNHSCPPEMLERLANDLDPSVRYAVAKNPLCPPEVLKRLAMDQGILMFRMVDESLSTSELPTRSTSSGDRIKRAPAVAGTETDRRLLAANSPLCPSEMLEQLAADPDSIIRRSVAKNPSCPLEALTQLARDKDTFVRVRVAQNPSCPRSDVLRLSRDNAGRVRSAAASNPVFIACPSSKSASNVGASLPDELSRLAELHKKGILTDEEFAAAKGKILGC